MLELRDVHAAYGKIPVVHGLDIEIAAGSLVSLLGANGAGKTTTLRVITGLLKPSRGEILFEGHSLRGLSPDRVVRLGISMVPEGRELFVEMTVEQNLRLGGFTKGARQVRHALETSFELFPRLRERRRQIAGTLSGGEQQMLTIARALMADPRLLLLDEPSLGLAPQMVEEVFRIIQRIKSRGVSVLLVEQNASMALTIADHAYVMETGEIRLRGPAAELQSNPEVQRAYLRA
jgi:branched-chain amino acid transport system ATP-binding protein